MFEWEIRPLPLADLTGLDFAAATHDSRTDAGRPVFHRFTHALGGAPGDAFLDMSGWGTGLVWLNGFLLGHYDTPRGPQGTRYAPGPTSAAPRSSPCSETGRAPGPALLD
ncbi:hypothetical protein [Streptomyces sp. NPDC006463]|uniref:hypothetical protein n=1 Tax=Streptomyces sp. NPDC006463 TaxID=3364746 RepID=UPI0036BC054E